jgi:Condensation domain
MLLIRPPIHRIKDLPVEEKMPDVGFRLLLQMGGNSLQAGAVCARVRAALQLEHPVPITWLMQGQTIKALAARLTEVADAAESGQPAMALPRLVATLSSSGDGTGSIAPLSFQQEQFYQLWNVDRTSAAYNSGFVMVLHGALDTAALQAAVQLVFERQQSLRTRFLLDEAEVPMQRVVAVSQDLLHIEQPLFGFGDLVGVANGSTSLVEGIYQLPILASHASRCRAVDCRDNCQPAAVRMST